MYANYLHILNRLLVVTRNQLLWGFTPGRINSMTGNLHLNE